MRDKQTQECFHRALQLEIYRKIFQVHPMEKKKLKPEEALMEAIGFTEEDLEANQAGVLSDQQRTSFINDRDYWNVLLLFWLLLWGGMSIFMVLLLILHSGAGLWIWLIAISAWFASAGFAFLSLRRRNQYTQQLDANTVETLEGRVRVDFVGEGFSITVEHMTWPLASSAVTAFRNGDMYIFYYSTLSGKILSVEWMGEE